MIKRPGNGPNPFPAVLVDKDGTLMDTEELGQRILARVWALEFPGEPLKAEELEFYVGRPDQEVLETLGRRRGLPSRRVAEMHRRFRRDYLEALRSNRLRVLDGVEAGLHRLQEGGRAMVLVTGSTREQVRAALGASPFPFEWWDKVVSADDYPLGKPSPEPYLLAAERVEVGINRCLVLEDSLPGVAAGRAAGAVVVHVGPYDPRNSLLADHHVERLDRLTDDALDGLWERRPLSPTVEESTLRRLGERLEHWNLFPPAGSSHSGAGEFWERWVALSKAPARDGGPEAAGRALFLGAEARPMAEVAAALGGEDLMEALVAAEILECGGDGTIHSRFRLVRVEGVTVLKEPPRLSAGGRWISRETYLDGSTEAVMRALDRFLNAGGRPRSVLEIGPGTGCVLIHLGRRGPDTRLAGVEIDGRALALARANLALAGLEGDLIQGDLWDGVSRLPDPRFELIFFHPPYRLLPEGVPYPDPLARYGTEGDGLGLVRRYLERLGEFLAEDGLGLAYVDFPLVDGKPDQELRELEKRAGVGMRLELIPQGEPVSDRVMARLTAEKCLNPREMDGDGGPEPGGRTVEEVERRVAAAYRDRRIQAVLPALLVAGRKGG